MSTIIPMYESNLKKINEEEDIKTRLLTHSASKSYLHLLQESSSTKESIRFQLLYGFIPIYSFCQLFIFFCLSAILWSAIKCVPLILFMTYLYFKCFIPKSETQDKVDDFLVLAMDLNTCESRKIRMNAELALSSLFDLGFDAGKRYLEELDQAYSSDETSYSNRNNHKKYVSIQIITIALLYLSGHFLCAIVEYGNITDVGNEYYTLQLLIMLGIHGSSCVFIIMDAHRVIKLLNMVDTLAKDICLCAKQSESFVEAEIY